jgi:competence ComEA-like helix-hairpin-helix protein
MLKKARSILLAHFCFISLLMLISATFFLGSGTNPAQAANKVDAQKGLVGLVDINSASQKELENIKGVGPVIAKQIIAGRPYKSVDELSKAGLSAKAVAALKPLVRIGKEQAAPSTAAVTLAPGTKININTADQATLQTLPDIGPVKAQAIIAGRPYKSVEELMKISGIKEKTFAAIKNYIAVK